jgi:hypothetical protein
MSLSEVVSKKVLAVGSALTAGALLGYAAGNALGSPSTVERVIEGGLYGAGSVGIYFSIKNFFQDPTAANLALITGLCAGGVYGYSHRLASQAFSAPSPSP